LLHGNRRRATAPTDAQIHDGVAQERGGRGATTAYCRITLTRTFIKLFRTGSSSTANECQVNFGFLPAKSQIVIRTASFFA